MGGGYGYVKLDRLINMLFAVSRQKYINNSKLFGSRDIWSLRFCQ
jgi:hypothetical protein